VLLSAVASVVELKSDSKKQKRGVAFFGSPDLFGIVPAFGPASWAPSNFAASAWNPLSNPDIAIAQVQVQAAHDVALQVCAFINCVITHIIFIVKLFNIHTRFKKCILY